MSVVFCHPFTRIEWDDTKQGFIIEWCNDQHTCSTVATVNQSYEDLTNNFYCFEDNTFYFSTEDAYYLYLDFVNKSFEIRDDHNKKVPFIPVINPPTVSENGSSTANSTEEYPHRMNNNKNMMMYGGVAVVVVVIGIGGIFLSSRYASSPENREKESKKSSLPKKVSKSSKSGKEEFYQALNCKAFL